MKINRFLTIAFFVLLLAGSKSAFFAYTPVTGGDVSVDDSYEGELPTNEDEPEYDIIVTPELDYLNISTFTASDCGFYYGLCIAEASGSSSTKYVIMSDSTLSAKYLNIYTTNKGSVEKIEVYTGKSVTSRVLYKKVNGVNRAGQILNYGSSGLKSSEEVNFKKFGSQAVPYISKRTYYQNGVVVKQDEFYPPVRYGAQAVIKYRKVYSNKKISKLTTYTLSGKVNCEYYYKGGKKTVGKVYNGNKRASAIYIYSSNGTWTKRTTYYTSGRVKQITYRTTKGKITSYKLYSSTGKLIKYKK